MKREFYQERISLPEENFGEQTKSPSSGRKSSSKGTRRSFSSFNTTRSHTKREDPLPDEQTVQEFSRSVRSLSAPLEDGYPHIVGRIPDCGGSCRRWASSDDHNRREERKEFRLSPFSMILFWGSGVAAGAILFFTMAVTGIVPIPSLEGGRMIAHDKTTSSSEEFSSEESVFTISSTEGEISEAAEVSDPVLSSIESKLSNSKTPSPYSVTEDTFVSRNKEQKELFKDIPSWNAPEFDTAEIPHYDSYLETPVESSFSPSIASASSSENPSTDHSWEETVSAARPQTDLPLSSLKEVGSSMTMDEVYSWGDLTAETRQKEIETSAFVPMKNGITRLDPSTAQMAAANNYYPESTYPQIPQDPSSYEFAQSGANELPVSNAVPADLPVGGAMGGRFSGYQVQPQTSAGRVSATAMRSEHGMR